MPKNWGMNRVIWLLLFPKPSPSLFKKFRAASLSQFVSAMAICTLFGFLNSKEYVITAQTEKAVTASLEVSAEYPLAEGHVSQTRSNELLPSLLWYIEMLNSLSASSDGE
jgi:hypothetical protein